MAEPPDDLMLYIAGGDPGRILLAMWVTDGQIISRYHPEDLDEATQEFLAEVKKASEQAFKDLGRTVYIDCNETNTIEREVDEEEER